jgi:FixJ family two-component response regulator
MAALLHLYRDCFDHNAMREIHPSVRQRDCRIADHLISPVFGRVMDLATYRQVRCEPALPVLQSCAAAASRSLDWPVNGIESMSAGADRPSTSQPSGSPDRSLVFIVDDDLSLRDALSSLLRSVGHQVEVFSSASVMLKSKLPDIVSCIVLDVRMPGLSGLDLQTELAEAGIRIPVIFMTGYGDIPMSVRAMKAGAIDFLTKPFRDQEILDAVALALDRDRKRRNDEKAVADLTALFDSLTRRERQVMALITDGLMNKQAAGKIGISEITVKIHRGNLMKKMRAKSLAELVRMADVLGVRGEASRWS